jgi:S-layer protein (TIGR01567 family)
MSKGKNMVIKRYSIVIAFVLMMGIVLVALAAQPEVSITAPGENANVKSSFEFVAHIISPVENINMVEFNITNTSGSVKKDITNPNRNTSSGESFTYTLNTAELDDGNYSLIVTASSNNETLPNSSVSTPRNFVINNNPPASVTDLKMDDNGTNWIIWSWTNPGDSDFANVSVYIDGIFKQNVSTPSYNATGLSYGNHEIATHTIDSAGNVNSTWVNLTNSTLPNTPVSVSPLTVTLQNSTVIFPSVSAGGNTVETINTSQPLPSGYTAVGNYTDISTTAIYSPPVTVSVKYNTPLPSGYTDSDVRLYHWNDSTSQWDNVTTSVDSTLKMVTGQVSSLSPFVPVTLPKPIITKVSPADPVVTTGTSTQTFDVTASQDANITWTIGSFTQLNSSVPTGTHATLVYTPSNSGNYTVSVTAANINGSDTESWNWTVQSKTYFQGNRVWDGSRPDLFSLEYTWNPMSFSGFYYNIDKDVGNESITIKLNDYDDRNIKAGNTLYETTPEEVGFGYSSFGSYQVIGFMADKYFAGYIDNTTITNARPSTTFAGKSALAQGQLHKVLIDDDTQRTVSIGSTLTLQEGYVLKATDIDTTARTMLISLLKDGSEVDTTPLSAGETYVYTKRIGAVQDLPIIMARFDNVFSGREVQAAFLKGLFQISETPTMVKTGNQFGSMEVTGVGGNGIQMDNKNAISLTEGSTQDLMGDMKLVVADNSSVIRYALSVGKTGDFEVRSSVYRDTDGDNAITEWNPYNFGMNIGKTSIGFYYNLDDGIGNESLKINPTSSLNVGGRTISDQGLVYTTTPQDVGFGYTNFGSYQAIGFMADKYFAGYTAGTTVNAKPSTSFDDKSAIAQGQLHKVLIDDDTQRTISVGGTLTLQEGYVLKATDIDTTARIMLITLLKDGSEVDTTPLAAGETYVYTKKIGAVRDLPIIMVRFDNVFSGREVQAAFLKGVFQISENPTVLKTGDHFGKMEVTGVSKDAIEMKNDGSLSLNQNSEDTLMGDVKLKVADSSDHLRFYFAVDVTPEMVANQLVIDAPSKITAGDVAIVKVTAGGAGVDGASVVLDSTDMGQTDSTGAVNFTLPKTLKGMYNITASKLGYQSATRSIEILQYVEYRLSMDAPAKANQFETIPIKITYNGTAIPGATVMYDNTTIGTTDSNGVLNYKLDTSGTHTLTASKGGYITVAREIEVRAPYSEYRALDINITPNSTFTNREVLIRSNITNAGTKGDTLPVELKVNNSVVDNRTITLSPGETQEINFTLKEAKPGNYTVEILGQKGIIEVKEAPLNYLLIGGIATGFGAIVIYVLTAKGKITLGEMKNKLNVDAIKNLLSKSGKKGI